MSEKECATCKIVKPLEQFFRNKNGRQGRLERCKECIKQVPGRKEYIRGWEVKRDFGISLQEYNELEAKQRCCAICGKTNLKLHLDHDHSTGKLRKFLCGSCNRGISLLQESPVLLKRAAQYLEDHNDNPCSNP